MLFQAASWIRLLFLSSVAWQVLAAPSAHQPDTGNRILEEEGLFEGDIQLPEGISEDRATVPEKAKLWPNGVIPYSIHRSSAGEAGAIRRAMASIEAVSCLRFVNRRKEDADYLLIYRGPVCSSFIGRQGGRQKLSLGAGCYDRSTIVHELMHAAGFFHEHTRSDRDEYVDIFEENVKKGKMHNFKKLQPRQNRLITGFDIQSVMLYGSKSFSRAPGLLTMLTKDGKQLPEVYNKKGLSSNDARRIRILYKCAK
ncbi:astacin-like metalloprotease toxin 5 isoform X2 [Amblyomma americanum]